MKQLTTSTSLLAAAATFGLAAGATAVEVELDFVGIAGTGLLPGNEVGDNTPVSPGASPSTATGGEIGSGLTYDTDTNVLAFNFEFSGLSGGLFDAASGMHLHLAEPGVDPQNETGGIAFNLNSGTDPNVMLTSSLIAIGSSGGTVEGTATLTEAQETALFAGRYYLNIHSGDFTGGELRGNLVPEPATATLLGLGGLAMIRRRG